MLNDIKLLIIKKMSGKTTGIYTHVCLCREHSRQVSNKSLSSITSPLDNINKGGNVEDKSHP